MWNIKVAFFRLAYYFGLTLIYLIGLTSIVATGGGGGRNSGSGTTPTTFSISGVLSGSKLQGVTITLSGSGTRTAITDTSGNYSFISLANGTYIVTPSHAGYTFTPSSTTVTISGANVTSETTGSRLDI